jgi:hypothetical protein
MEIEKNRAQPNSRPRRIAEDLALCLSKIVGKFAAYPEVDPAAFQRMHSALERGLVSMDSPARLGDYCQELRSVAKCPARELLSFPRAGEIDARIAAIAQVVSQNAQLKEESFRELLTALLSWQDTDKRLILDVLTEIIHGKAKS